VRYDEILEQFSEKTKKNSKIFGQVAKKPYLCTLFMSEDVKVGTFGQVLYDQLPLNPPGLDRSKGRRL
jgi:hypothetical protein